MTRSRSASNPERGRIGSFVVASVIVVVAACTQSTDSTAPAPSTTTTSSTSSPTTSITSGPTSTTLVELPGGPSYDRDFPDPFVAWMGAGYHAIATTSGFLRVPHLDSTGLTNWVGPSDLLGASPPWATPLSTWGPSMLERPGHFVVYFAAQVRGTDMHCISVAVGTSIDGPFDEVRDTPLLCPSDLGGAIDPSPFIDADGTPWLLWKNDGVTLRRTSAIWSQRLSDDGLELVGDPVKLIGTDQSWEYPHVEAPSMARVGSAYWLAYSGNWWNQAAYGIGMAECASPIGPCTKPFDHPLLATEPGREGPGGAEFLVDESGRLLLAYHAWLGTPGYPGHRALFIASVRFDDSGRPVLGGAVP